MKQKLLIILTLVPLISGFGQDRLDLFTLSGRYGFPATYDSIYKGNGTETGVMSSLVAPARLSQKSIWYSSLNYFYWSVNNSEDMPDDVMNPIQIHGFILRTGLIQKFEKDRSLQVLIAPRLMTDFRNLDVDHLQMGGLVVYEKKYHEKLRMGFGALYNQEFFGPNLVPLVNLDWKINNKWSIVGLLPIYAKIKYKFTERLDGGLSHFGLVTTYRLGDPDYEGDYIERKSIDEALYARYQLFGDFFLEGRFGYALGRSYKQYEADQKVDLSIPLVTFGDNRIAKTASIHDGLIASLRLVYSISIKDNSNQ